jgi:Fic family protein
MLLQEAEIPLQSPRDIRAIYDDLVLEEVRSDKSDNAPDGKLFRKGPVSVYSAAGQEIHQGLRSEEKITEYLEESLRLVSDEGVELPIRAGIFHYLFGYLHPFYDGNGRTNRFISSYLLTKEYESLVGFRLSYAITQSIGKYYRGFTLCNDPLNKGDLTPFVIMFLGIVKQAVDEIVQTLTEKDALYRENLGRLRHVPAVADDKDVFDFATALLQARMFSGDGITTQALARVFDVSRPTVAKRLSQIESAGLLERERMGREVHLQIDLDELARITSGAAG